MIKVRKYIYVCVCIIFLFICFFKNLSIVNASTIIDNHEYFKIFLENVDSKSTYKIQFSMENSSSSDNHYELLTIFYKNGKVLDAIKKDCGLYYYSNPINEKHEYDITEKTKIQKDGDIIVLLIEDLNGNEIGNYNTLTIFKNDVEIMKFKDNDYFCDNSLTAYDYSDVYKYSNIKIDLNQNKVEVLRENHVEHTGHKTSIGETLEVEFHSKIWIILLVLFVCIVISIICMLIAKLIKNEKFLQKSKKYTEKIAYYILFITCILISINIASIDIPIFNFITFAILLLSLFIRLKNKNKIISYVVLGTYLEIIIILCNNYVVCDLYNLEYANFYKGFKYIWIILLFLIFSMGIALLCKIIARFNKFGKYINNKEFIEKLAYYILFTTGIFNICYTMYFEGVSIVSILIIIIWCQFMLMGSLYFRIIKKNKKISYFILGTYFEILIFQVLFKILYEYFYTIHSSYYIIHYHQMFPLIGIL